MIEKPYIITRKLLNILVKKGKKGKALKILLLLLKNLKYKKINNYQSFGIICKALYNLKPLVQMQKIRKSRKIFYLPKIISIEKKISLALRWIVKSANVRKERKLENRLTKEFLDCFFNKGLSILKKRSLYKTLSMNRPFLHFLINK